ncbi:MAG TPA: Zn-ribbon domain-containing OB-fold protein [Acidimicrobiales bacterium]|nr:Zn-ribbon domain-containing OB-fold protein [Acidimicrobiales bacterium]
MAPEAPQVDESTEQWWAALGEGELLVPRCEACGRLHLYPRRFCPYCWSTALTWEQASGRGRVYTFSTIYVNDLGSFGAEVPYTVAVVELAEGPRLEARLAGCPPEEVVIGMPVEMVFERREDGVTVPTFGPVKEVS